MEQTITISASSSSWGWVATDGTLYASLALLHAAGKEAWPIGAFPPGVQPAHLILANQSSADTATAGAGFFFAINRGDEFSSLASDTVRDAHATPVFSGQTFSYPGANFISSIPILSVQVRKTTAGDLLQITAISG